VGRLVNKGKATALASYQIPEVLAEKKKRRRRNALKMAV